MGKIIDKTAQWGLRHRFVWFRIFPVLLAIAWIVIIYAWIIRR